MKTEHAAERTTGEWTCGGDDVQPAEHAADKAQLAKVKEGKA